MKYIAFVYAWMIIIGAYMFVFTSGGVIKICIACNSTLTNVLGAVSIIIGLAGLANSFRGKTAA